MVLISVAGVLSTPLLMLIEALQTHFDKPEIIFTLSDIYSDSVLYIMLLVNIMIYVAIAAYLFSREYTESTLKTILPIPISRTKLLIGKFCTLLLWIVMLTLVTWAGIFRFPLSPVWKSSIWIHWLASPNAMRWIWGKSAKRKRRYSP